KVTPLFDSMLVQQTEDEGDVLERPFDSPPIPSPPYPSEDQPQIQPDPSPRPLPTSHRSLSGNEDVLTLQSVSQLRLKKLKLEAKERSQTTYHTSQILDENKIGKEDFFEEKGGYTRNPAFDDLDDFVDVDDTLDYMETEDDQNEGKTSFVVLEEKESTNKEVSTKDPVSTNKGNEGTDKGNEGTDKQDGGTDSTKVSTDRQGEVEIRNVEETERLRPTSTRLILTLRPLPKIDPKDKGNKRIEKEDESNTESEGIIEAEKKFKQLVNDEEVARKVQEEWEAEEEKKRLTEEEATKAALSNEYDFIQARLNADKILAEKIQKEEREMYTIEQRTKFLHETIVAQRRFLAQQRSEAIRNKPPSRNQLRNQMMTYLKHVGGKKHSDLKTKSFDEIQVLYEKIKRSNDSFIAIGSAKDEKGEIKEEEGTRKRKLGKRKKMKSKKIKFTSKDDEELRLCLTIAPDEDTEVDYEILDKKYQDETPEGFDKILWGDLIIMFNQSDSDEFWNAQQSWKIVSWKLHSSSGIHTIMTDEGLVIHMFVENKYPLKKEVLSQLIELKLETKEDSTMALELIRFVKKQIAELEPTDSDGDEEDP
ncbi:hypothetical protein Tco_0934905, partial [Tanacetum coccineum]